MEVTHGDAAYFAISRSICHSNLWKRVDKQVVYNEHLDNRFFTIATNGEISIIDDSRLAAGDTDAGAGLRGREMSRKPDRTVNPIRKSNKTNSRSPPIRFTSNFVAQLSGIPFRPTATLPPNMSMQFHIVIHALSSSGVA